MYYLKGQKHFNDCAKACVATILGLYNIDYKYKEIGEINSFLDILVKLRSYNIDATPVHSNKITMYPCIVQVKRLRHYHFIVMYEEKDNKFIYYSPNKLTIHKISKKRFYKYYTSKCININSTKQYSNYKFCINSIPFAIKLIIIDIFLIILIISLLNV